MEPLKVEENECSDPNIKVGLHECEHTQSCEGSSYVTSQLVKDESPNHLWHNVCPDPPQNPNSGKHNQPFVIKTESDTHVQSFLDILSEDKDKPNLEESCVIVIKPESGILDKRQGGYAAREMFEMQSKSKECLTALNENVTYIASNQVDELLIEQSEWNADEIIRDQASDRQYSTEGCHVQLTSEEPAITRRLMNTACTFYTCQKCHAVFSCQSELTIHLRSHTGERPFACQTCDKFGTFKKHPITHNVKAKRRYVCPTTTRREEPYVCPSCNKRCFSPSALEKHIRKKHTVEQPHVCPTYNKGFVSSPVASIPVTSYSSNELSTSTVSDVSQTHSGLLSHNPTDRLDKLPGYNQVESFTTYLVELEKGLPKQEIKLKRYQTGYIVNLWKNMLPFDRYPITQLSSGNITETKKRGNTKTVSSETPHPNSCRVVELLCEKLCLNHPCSKDVHGQILDRWTQILNSYNRICEMVLSSKLVMEQKHLHLLELDQLTLIQWYNKRRDLWERCALMQGWDVSAQTAPSKQSSAQSPKSPQSNTTSQDSLTMIPKKLRKSGMNAKLQQSNGVTYSQNQTKEKYDIHQTCSKQLSPPSSVKEEGSSLGLLCPQSISQPELMHVYEQDIDEHSGINKINKVTTETRQVESWKHHREANLRSRNRTIDNGCASNVGLTVHVTKHKEKNLFVCNLCGKRFTRFLQFKEHVTKCKKHADAV